MTLVAYHDLGAWYLCQRCGKPTGRPGKTQYCGPCGIATYQESHRRTAQEERRKGGIGEFRAIPAWNAMPNPLRDGA